MTPNLRRSQSFSLGKILILILMRDLLLLRFPRPGEGMDEARDRGLAFGRDGLYRPRELLDLGCKSGFLPGIERYTHGIPPVTCCSDTLKHS